MRGPYDLNPAGFTTQSIVHAARRDTACVMHTHIVTGLLLFWMMVTLSRWHESEME